MVNNKKFINKLGTYGLALLVGVASCNTRLLNPVGLPSGTGRHVTLFESDLQEAENSDLYVGVGGSPGYTGLSAQALRDKNGNFPPFNVDVASGPLEENVSSKWYLKFSDNGREFTDGEQWFVRLQANTNHDLNLYFHNILDSPPEIVRVTYRKGHSNEQLEEVIDEIN